MMIKNYKADNWAFAVLLLTTLVAQVEQ